MDIYLPNMEMPKNCTECSCLNDEYWSCQASKMGLFGEGADKKRPDWCPLIPVSPHGRLIDADALEELVIKQKYACAGASAHGAITELHKSWGLHDAELMIEAAPTVIPASEEGE